MRVCAFRDKSIYTSIESGVNAPGHPHLSLFSAYGCARNIPYKFRERWHDRERVHASSDVLQSTRWAEEDAECAGEVVWNILKCTQRMCKTRFTITHITHPDSLVSHIVGNICCRYARRNRVTMTTVSQNHVPRSQSGRIRLE